MPPSGAISAAIAAGSSAVLALIGFLWYTKSLNAQKLEEEVQSPHAARAHQTQRDRQSETPNNQPTECTSESQHRCITMDHVRTYCRIFS